MEMPPSPIRLQRLIIGAPFGNYISRRGYATSVIGTYTRHHRGNAWYRLWRMLRTLRYDRYAQGWINKLGLPNPGILSLMGQDRVMDGMYDKVLSIHGFHTIDWQRVIGIATRLPVMALELNCSCPNVKNDPTYWDDVFDFAVNKWGQTSGLIVKLPPVGWRPLVEHALNHGIHAFHCCNTLPTPRGGLSGPVLKQFSLEVISSIKTMFIPPDGTQPLVLIGGGGISTSNDIADYIEAGATHFAVASMLLNPWRHVKHIDRKHGALNGLINYLEVLEREGYAGEKLPARDWPVLRNYSHEF